jgi:hypothetical protein
MATIFRIAILLSEILLLEFPGFARKLTKPVFQTAGRMSGVFLTPG